MQQAIYIHEVKVEGADVRVEVTTPTGASARENMKADGTFSAPGDYYVVNLIDGTLRARTHLMAGDGFNPVGAEVPTPMFDAAFRYANDLLRRWIGGAA